MTKLTAVNKMLRTLGEPAATALDTGGTSLEGKAEAILDEEIDLALAMGWAVNTEEDLELVVPDTQIAASGGSGTFTFDETVTESVSGATGSFRYEEGGNVYLESVSGTFTGGETLTGADSGATRTGGAYTAITEAKHKVDPDFLHVEPWRTEAKRFVDRGGFLYDIDDQTSTFDQNVKCEVLRDLDFADLPIKLAEYIARRASVEFQRAIKRGTIDEQLVQLELRDAFIQARQEDNDLRQANMFNSADIRRLRGNRDDRIIRSLSI